MIDLVQIRTLIIVPTLEIMAPAIARAPSDVPLLVGTAIHESESFRYIAQIGGPALSWWMVEPATYEDNWHNFIDFRPALRQMVLDISGGRQLPAQALLWNLSLACAMARIKYARAPEPLPESDPAALYAFYKARYNSSAGAATAANSLSAFQAAIAA